MFPLPLAYIIHCSLHHKDGKSLQILDPFWNDMLVSWSMINFHEPSGKDEILNQNLWCNSNIKCGGEVMIRAQLYNSGLRKIEDLFNRNRLCSWAEIHAKYQDISFMQYYWIVSAILQS